MSAHAVPGRPAARPRALPALLTRAGGGVWLGAGVAAVLGAISFGAGGASSLGPTTTVEMALTIAGGAMVAVCALTAARPAATATTSAVGLLALGALSAASIMWSEAPAASWLEASRLFAYAALYTAVLAGARVAPQRWASVMGGIVGAGAIVCIYALATKVFPGALAPNDPYARLREPFGYWNAVGLTAALTVVPCLWLGSRREGHPAVSALAYPIAGIALTVLMLAYSRGALVALVLGGALWFAAAPRRLRSAAVLLSATAGAAPAVAWAFSQPALTQNQVDLATRAQSGHELGLLVGALAVLLMATGLAVGFYAHRHPPSNQRRDQLGLGLVVALALVPVGVAGGLALSSRGLTGSASHAFTALTDPHSRTPPNDPSRLTGVASVRARYWNEALKVLSDHPLIGAGADGYAVARQRYRAGNLSVHHAHGYVVQTLADLGALGLALSLLVLGAWGWAALAAVRPLRWAPRLPWRPRAAVPIRSPTAIAPERTAMICLLACVVTFGAHSLIDWSWSVPGDACLALLCGAWLAGRAPARQASDAPVTALWPSAPALLRPRQRSRIALAVGILGLAVILGWSEWQPLRAAGASDSSLAALQRHDIAAARSDAENAARIDPVSVEPLFDLAVIESSVANIPAARDALQRAVRRQPTDALAWLRLADLELYQGHDPQMALTDLRPALYLDPHNPDVIDEFLAAMRQITPDTNPATASPGSPGTGATVLSAPSPATATAPTATSPTPPGG